jgi:Cytochrome c554 and c-prime
MSNNLSLSGCVAILSLTFSAAGAERVAAQAADKSSPATAYASAKTCAKCHTTIHTYWSESAHSQAAVRPAFLRSLSEAEAAATDKKATRQACLSCHAPTSLVTGDDALQLAITREGVSCDFCHTVAAVDLAKTPPFDMQPGKVKRGPLDYAKVMGHETAYSLLHRSSPLLCAACHEHKNAAGVRVLSNYSEWLESPYPARGMNCQECHLPLVPGSTVREGLSSSGRRINLHRMSGGGLPVKVRFGLEFKIVDSRLSADAAEVDVSLANTAVGHRVPGGLSTKALVVAVGIENRSGQLINRQERVYRRQLLDASGQVITNVADLFSKAASVGEDNRLKPGESKSEHFTLPVADDSVAIVARLEYRDSSVAGASPETTLVVEERRDIRAR